MTPDRSTNERERMTQPDQRPASGDLVLCADGAERTRGLRLAPDAELVTVSQAPSLTGPPRRGRLWVTSAAMAEPEGTTAFRFANGAMANPDGSWTRWEIPPS